MLNRFIDHTLLKQATKKEDIKKLCEEAIKYDFFSVCVNPSYVAYAKEYLKGSHVKIASVIGFPLGENKTITKVFETKEAIKDGADEIDMVISVSRLVDQDYDYVLNDIKAVVGCGAPVKVIFETSQLNNEQIEKATELSILAGATFIKTSTGFVGEGATEEKVSLMLKCANGRIKVKASGGIREYETAKKYVDMGVQRLGTSGGVKIVNIELENID